MIEMYSNSGGIIMVDEYDTEFINKLKTAGFTEKKSVKKTVRKSTKNNPQED